MSLGSSCLSHQAHLCQAKTAFLLLSNPALVYFIWSTALAIWLPTCAICMAVVPKPLLNCSGSGPTLLSVDLQQAIAPA